jgi:hypothetical protein
MPLVVERDSQVMGEPQVVTSAVAHPFARAWRFLCSLLRRAAQGVPGDAVVAVVGLPGVVAGDVREGGSTPAVSMASLPHLGCTVTRTNLPADAEWTQASFPATRNPVSSSAPPPPRPKPR